MKPRLKIGIFKCISWLNGLLFGGDHLGVAWTKDVQWKKSCGVKRQALCCAIR
jgi:hypothetical protein